MSISLWIPAELAGIFFDNQRTGIHVYICNHTVDRVIYDSMIMCVHSTEVGASFYLEVFSTGSKHQFASHMTCDMMFLFLACDWWAVTLVVLKEPRDCPVCCRCCPGFT